MDQEQYQKLMHIRRRLAALKKRGVIHDFRVRSDAIILPIGIQFNDSGDWIFFTIDRLLMKLKDGTFLKEAELRV